MNPELDFNRMYVVGFPNRPYEHIIVKLKRGAGVLAFASREDGNFYLRSRNGQGLGLITLKEALDKNPKAFSSIKLLYLNSSQAVQLMLSNPETFPYDEFFVDIP